MQSVTELIASLVEDIGLKMVSYSVEMRRYLVSCLILVLCLESVSP